MDLTSAMLVKLKFLKIKMSNFSYFGQGCLQKNSWVALPSIYLWPLVLANIPIIMMMCHHIRWSPLYDNITIPHAFFIKNINALILERVKSSVWLCSCHFKVGAALSRDYWFLIAIGIKEEGHVAENSQFFGKIFFSFILFFSTIKAIYFPEEIWSYPS